MAPPRYKIILTPSERFDLVQLTKTRKVPALKFAFARALLLCDAGEDGPAWKVVDVAAALGLTTRTIENLKRRVAEDGVEAFLKRAPRIKPSGKTIFDGTFAARTTTLACDP